jgi:ubiquinone biosynthesis protein
MTLGIFDLLSSVAEKLKSADDPSKLLQVVMDPFARTILSEYHDNFGVQTILDETWARYRDIEQQIPVLTQLGPTINVRLAGATLAMYETLLSAGHSNVEALAIFKRISWAIYDKMGDLPMIAATALTSDPHNRMKLATQMFRTFPFSSPDYLMVDIPSAGNVVGFDVLTCPVAEFFRSHGREELCRETWCELDFPLAEKWGGELERTTTIAEGADRCDFRWKTPPQNSVLGESHGMQEARLTPLQ